MLSRRSLEFSRVTAATDDRVLIQLLLREDNLVDFQSSPHPCTTPVAWSGFARAIPTTWTRPAPYSSDGTGHMIHRAIWGGYAMIEKYVSESGSPRVYCEE